MPFESKDFHFTRHLKEKPFTQRVYLMHVQMKRNVIFFLNWLFMWCDQGYFYNNHPVFLLKCHFIKYNCDPRTWNVLVLLSCQQSGSSRLHARRITVTRSDRDWLENKGAFDWSYLYLRSQTERKTINQVFKEILSFDINQACDRSDSCTYKWLLLDSNRCRRMSDAISILSVRGSCDGMTMRTSRHHFWNYHPVLAFDEENDWREWRQAWRVMYCQL